MHEKLTRDPFLASWLYQPALEIEMGLPRAFFLLIAGAFFCPSVCGVEKLDVEWKVCC